MPVDLESREWVLYVCISNIFLRFITSYITGFIITRSVRISSATFF